ncbi:unnamed protein product [Caenorhabditis angaria]|uniref:DUF281 domain-containing protein n=1 Tax=Caenorhabditis angaria TaxID=860376 RepID=A0A9P1IBD8_9PELO|nr:unnamed protein product [Caenorhabditis angaria]
MWLIFLLLIPAFVFSKCKIELLQDECPTCCAILYSSDSCEIDQLNMKINVKDKNRGALGAMWDNVAQVVVVRNGCLLEAWDFRNQTGPKRTFGLDGYEVYYLQRYSFSARMSSLRCDCNADPIPEHQMQGRTTTTTTTTTEEPPDEVREILELEEGSGQFSIIEENKNNNKNGTSDEIVIR